MKIGTKVVYIGQHTQVKGEIYDIKNGWGFFHSYEDPYFSGWVLSSQLMKGE